MSDPLVIHEAVARLRSSAELRDWNGCRAALDDALRGVPSADVVGLAEAQLRDGLDVFERHHPGAYWPRRALNGVAGDSLDEYPGPGGNSYAKGVAHLLEVRSGDPEACRRAAVDAISEAIMAAMIAEWGAAHPEQWAKWYQAVRAGEPATSLLGFRREAPVAERERAGWEAVASRLEHIGGGSAGRGDPRTPPTADPDTRD